MIDELVIARLKPDDALPFSQFLTTQNLAYIQYFTPFPFDYESIKVRLENAQKDRYWGVYFLDKLMGFFMLRGFDEGYARPSFGIIIDENQRGKGLATLALRYCITWCALQNVQVIMLKVHPDNVSAKKIYEQEGFTIIGQDEHNHNWVMERKI